MVKRLHIANVLISYWKLVMSLMTLWTHYVKPHWYTTRTVPGGCTNTRSVVCVISQDT